MKPSLPYSGKRLARRKPFLAQTGHPQSNSLILTVTSTHSFLLKACECDGSGALLHPKNPGWVPLTQGRLGGSDTALKQAGEGPWLHPHT